MGRVTIEFFDLVTKKKFRSNNFHLETRPSKKGKRITYFAVADNPSGSESWKIISRDNYEKFRAEGMEDRS